MKKEALKSIQEGFKMKVKGLFKKAIGGMTTVAVIACMLLSLIHI